jgi:hypothetical protein
LINNLPPRVSYVAEGTFDEELIAGKLTELGYEKTDYGPHSYYGIRDDLEMDLRNPLGKVVLASMNRLAVFDDTLIMSPVTEDVTGIFDAMAGGTPSVIDNAACQALADSLGDVLMAVMTMPERIISSVQDMGDEPVFDFTIPGTWGQLHRYEMAALGYHAEGNKRFLDIVLYYTDKETAMADGVEIVNRMQSYTLNTWVENSENIIAFTERFQPGEPVVEKYPDGAVLKIACQLIPEERRGVSMLIGGTGMPFRDLLFLTPDPSPYIKK